MEQPFTNVTIVPGTFTQINFILPFCRFYDKHNLKRDDALLLNAFPSYEEVATAWFWNYFVSPHPFHISCAINHITHPNINYTDRNNTYFPGAEIDVFISYHIYWRLVFSIHYISNHWYVKGAKKYNRNSAWKCTQNSSSMRKSASKKASYRRYS